MTRIQPLSLIAARSPRLLAGLAIGALLVNACGESQSPLPTAPPAEFAKAKPAAFHGNRADFPPNGWVFHPIQLPPGFTKYECIFEHSGIQGPNTACQSRQWGQSRIYREQSRNLIAIGPVAQELCGGPAHFDVTRVCSEAWFGGTETPWGEAGPRGCVIISGGDLICGAV